MRLRLKGIGMATALCLVSFAQGALGETRGPILAQTLIDEVKASNSAVVTIGIHAKAPGSDGYAIVAHTNPASIGHKSEGADLVTLATGKVDGPNPLPGGVFDVGVTLRDRAGKKVGFLAVHYRPAAEAADPKKDALDHVLKISKDLSPKIPSEEALFRSSQ